MHSVVASFQEVDKVIRGDGGTMSGNSGYNQRELFLEAVAGNASIQSSNSIPHTCFQLCVCNCCFNNEDTLHQHLRDSSNYQQDTEIPLDTFSRFFSIFHYNPSLPPTTFFHICGDTKDGAVEIHGIGCTEQILRCAAERTIDAV